MNVSDSPLFGQTLADFGAAFRSGHVKALDVTRAMLERITKLEPKLQAFTYVDEKNALAQAAKIDALWASGQDLGPLMGVPVAVKDIFTIEDMPTHVGSRLALDELIPPQGPFITSLQQAGCVLLGKTVVTEFCLGGVNLTHPIPWNPCDLTTPRMTGGSSHGSAVAMAAALAGFTIGGDTGGSVRWPAALCGVTGFKSSVGLWSTEGVFPLSPQFDTVGIFTASAHDAAIVEAALRQGAMRAPPLADGMKLAISKDHFMENLDDEVAECFDQAMTRLRDAGVRLVEVPMLEAAEIDEVFAGIVPADLISFLGRERLNMNWSLIDPVAASRIEKAFDMSADIYAKLVARQKALEKMMAERFKGIDAFLSPTVPVVPKPTADFQTVELASAWNKLATQNTRPANLFNQCAISLPIHHLGSSLPVGLQLSSTAGSDAAMLAIARTVQDILSATEVL
jgi:aspartyl-tRNA(Asn)/glutamyl-tRNA(Gln) amidotransferase subunit A